MNVKCALIGCVTIVAAACGPSHLEQRRAEVAEAGRAVMPFDLDQTTHVFEKTAIGGVQTVVADEENPEQVALVRSHLTEEADRFARGDFHDPAMIHGGDMAGMHVLVTRYKDLKITYREIERGAEIKYESAEADLVEALHLWFEAQLRDHGRHARGQR